jgi:hypothetical protein
MTINNAATFLKLPVTTSAKDKFTTLCKAKNLNKHSLNAKNLQKCPKYITVESKRKSTQTPLNFPKKRLQVHQKMVGILKKMKIPINHLKLQVI